MIGLLGLAAAVSACQAAGMTPSRLIVSDAARPTPADRASLDAQRLIEAMQQMAVIDYHEDLGLTRGEAVTIAREIKLSPEEAAGIELVIQEEWTRAQERPLALAGGPDKTDSFFACASLSAAVRLVSATGVFCAEINKSPSNFSLREGHILGGGGLGVGIRRRFWPKYVQREQHGLTRNLKKSDGGLGMSVGGGIAIVNRGLIAQRGGRRDAIEGSYNCTRFSAAVFSGLSCVPGLNPLSSPGVAYQAAASAVEVVQKKALSDPIGALRDIYDAVYETTPLSLFIVQGPRLQLGVSDEEIWVKSFSVSSIFGYLRSLR